jgi:hypothetical protein
VLRQRMLYITKLNWFCRWCGSKYWPQFGGERDGFCPGGRCKQAWWRAIKKYRRRVTATRSRIGLDSAGCRSCKVTHARRADRHADQLETA